MKPPAPPHGYGHEWQDGWREGYTAAKPSAADFCAALDRLGGSGLPIAAVYYKALHILKESPTVGWDNRDVIDAVMRAAR